MKAAVTKSYYSPSHFPFLLPFPCTFTYNFVDTDNACAVQPASLISESCKDNMYLSSNSADQLLLVNPSCVSPLRFVSFVRSRILVGLGTYGPGTAVLHGMSFFSLLTFTFTLSVLISHLFLVITGQLLHSQQLGLLRYITGKDESNYLFAVPSSMEHEGVVMYQRC
ncbi:hypothetical protein BJV74DRAFT_180333 [Russula compacta]|nr:hypothetical protein BJV74DRAFT_180333 [Russula compacta]